jgi:hypothetical protein
VRLSRLLTPYAIRQYAERRDRIQVPVERIGHNHLDVNQPHLGSLQKHSPGNNF